MHNESKFHNIQQNIKDLIEMTTKKEDIIIGTFELYALQHSKGVELGLNIVGKF